MLKKIWMLISICYFSRLNNLFCLAGFNVEKVEYKNVDFTVWDVGGQGRHYLRPLWKNYFPNIDGLVRINVLAFTSLSRWK